MPFTKEYTGPTLRPLCDVIDDVINMKILFWHNLGRSFHIWGQIEAAFNILNFSKCPPFWARHTLFTGYYTGSWIYQKDSHEHFRHFKFLIDAVAQILTEIYQFKKLTYFVILWRHQWRHECVKHNLHNYTSPTMCLQNIVCVAPVLSMLNRPDNHRDKQRQTHTHTNTHNRVKTLSPRYRGW